MLSLCSPPIFDVDTPRGAQLWYSRSRYLFGVKSTFESLTLEPPYPLGPKGFHLKGDYKIPNQPHPYVLGMAMWCTAEGIMISMYL